MTQILASQVFVSRAIGSASSHRSASPDNLRPALVFQGFFRLVEFASTCDDEMGPSTPIHPSGPEVPYGLPLASDLGPLAT
jgi:hypothetical protein